VGDFVLLNFQMYKIWGDHRPIVCAPNAFFHISHNLLYFETREPRKWTRVKNKGLPNFAFF